MSSSAALQDLVYDMLATCPVLAPKVGGRIYDNPPVAPSYPYISFGPASAVPDDADCLDGDTHTLQIDIWTSEGGSKRECKVISDAVRRLLHDAEIEMEEPFSMVGMRVILNRVMGDPTPGIAHGVIQVEVMIEAS